MGSPGKRLKIRKRESKNHEFQAGKEGLKRIKQISLTHPAKLIKKVQTPLLLISLFRLALAILQRLLSTGNVASMTKEY